MSALVIQKSYTIQKVSHFPKNLNRLIGKKALLLDIVGSTASVQSIGTKYWVPIRSLIYSPTYVMKGVNIANAHAIAVVLHNNLIKVGEIFNKWIVLKDGYQVTYNGRSCILPANHFAHMVLREKKEVPIDSKAASKNVGISPRVIEEAAKLIAPASFREPITKIPLVLARAFQETDIDVLRERLRGKSGTYSDYNGEVHATIADCDKANTRILHQDVIDTLLRELEAKIQEEAQSIRDVH